MSVQPRLTVEARTAALATHTLLQMFSQTRFPMALQSALVTIHQHFRRRHRRRHRIADSPGCGPFFVVVRGVLNENIRVGASKEMFFSRVSFGEYLVAAEASFHTRANGQMTIQLLRPAQVHAALGAKVEVVSGGEGLVVFLPLRRRRRRRSRLARAAFDGRPVLPTQLVRLTRQNMFAQLIRIFVELVAVGADVRFGGNVGAFGEVVGAQGLLAADRVRLDHVHLIERF